MQSVTENRGRAATRAPLLRCNLSSLDSPSGVPLLQLNWNASQSQSQSESKRQESRLIFSPCACVCACVCLCVPQAKAKEVSPVTGERERNPWPPQQSAQIMNPLFEQKVPSLSTCSAWVAPPLT